MLDGTWGEAQPEAQSGMVVFEDGDQVPVGHHQPPPCAAIRQHPRSPLGRHFQLDLPEPGAINEVGPGKRLELATDDGLSFPKERVARRPSVDAEPLATRVETVKLFATAYPTDFRALVRQEGMRRGTESFIGETTMLWELLDMALTGYGSRRSRPVQLPLDQEWITVDRSFALLRKGEQTWLR